MPRYFHEDFRGLRLTPIECVNIIYRLKGFFCARNRTNTHGLIAPSGSYPVFVNSRRSHINGSPFSLYAPDMPPERAFRRPSSTVGEPHLMRRQKLVFPRGSKARMYKDHDSYNLIQFCAFSRTSFGCFCWFNVLCMELVQTSVDRRDGQGAS
jgi:hypothetical protein